MQTSPGPWKLETRAHVHAIVDANGQEVTYQSKHSTCSLPRTGEELLGNAQLIAAALDLYKAARAAMIVVNNFRPDGSIAADLRAAICKAEGRDPVSGLALGAPVAPIAPTAPAIVPPAQVFSVAEPEDNHVFHTKPSEPAKAPTLARFEVGKEYYVRSLCDHDCIYRFTVVARTAKQVTLRSKNETKTTVRGVKELRSDYSNCETCMPHGNYSMAACLHADRVVPEDGIIP